MGPWFSRKYFISGKYSHRLNRFKLTGKTSGGKGF